MLSHYKERNHPSNGPRIVISKQDSIPLTSQILNQLSGNPTPTLPKTATSMTRLKLSKRFVLVQLKQNQSRLVTDGVDSQPSEQVLIQNYFTVDPQISVQRHWKGVAGNNIPLKRSLIGDPLLHIALHKLRFESPKKSASKFPKQQTLRDGSFKKPVGFNDEEITSSNCVNGSAEPLITAQVTESSINKKNQLQKQIWDRFSLTVDRKRSLLNPKNNSKSLFKLQSEYAARGKDPLLDLYSKPDFISKLSTFNGLPQKQIVRTTLRENQKFNLIGQAAEWKSTLRNCSVMHEITSEIADPQHQLFTCKTIDQERHRNSALMLKQMRRKQDSKDSKRPHSTLVLRQNDFLSIKKPYE